MKYLHSMVRVRDLDASLRFYCEGLGLRETRRMDSAMKELVACEQRQEINPDVPTRLFGEVLAAAFSYPGEYCS